MKINILSPGRFHVLDLARELDKQGFDVKFYSFVPTKRAMSFGLPKYCSSSLFIPMLPFLCLKKLFRNQEWTMQLSRCVQDRLTALVMRKCDVLIAMSGEFIEAPKKAKAQGAKIIIERGSKHILEQKRILESIPSNKGKKPVPDANVKRELECYEIADYISIASEQVKESFTEYNYPVNKLFVNPYGVDLSMFSPINTSKLYDVLYVGNWSYQKGCDLILPAIQKLGLSFLHVGAISDVEFRVDNKCHHHDPVDQKELLKYYNSSKVFILPSRQDGFGMVLSQAVACNLPIIGSKDNGAVDLKSMVANPDCVFVIKEFTIEAVMTAIKEALIQYDNLGSTIYAGEAIQNLTWEAYGNRYAEFLNQINQM